ncbi:hypothetical protein ABW20_dc0102443 [Dactylellina cionopaga]|nr:hypothetical protein ABW20_dc0102443 [Dactylellina cionopaga]
MAGGAVLCAGWGMPLPAVVEVVIHYRVNAITGDGSQMLQFANYVAAMPAEERAKININKVIYTSDALNRDQRKLVSSVLGAKILSVHGSAEAGPWSVANLEITEEPEDDGVDFIFDKRMMKFEILPPSILDGPTGDIRPVPDGEKGIIVQTSLSRLRNPLVRYVTGDIGSLRHFPNTDRVSAEDAKHFQVLRFYGRDRRFSFKWYGEYFEFPIVKALLQTEGWGILQYQIVLDTLENKEAQLDLRLYRSDESMAQGERVPPQAILDQLEEYFVVVDNNRHLFKVTFVADLAGFERSKTGSKVMNFLDRRVK